MRKLVFAVALLWTGTLMAQPKYHKVDKGDFIEVTQDGGRTLGFSQH